MRVTLTGAGDAKHFDVLAAEYQTDKGELTLTARDGRVCLGLQGSWLVSIEESRSRPMGCEDIERIHDGRGIVLVS